uniref:MCM_N domain-containing protein n=1 Tax=Echinostoma caproni TaxID=27848 RepID=A0A183BC63_9TREM
LSDLEYADDDLNLESNQALDYENLKAALVAEFSKEGDRQKAMNRFYAAEYNGNEDPLVHYQYVKRQISLGLPEANNKTRERLTKDRFIQSIPAQMTGKLRPAVACGVNDADRLISIAQACQPDDVVTRVDPGESEDKIEQTFEEIRRLKEELKEGASVMESGTKRALVSERIKNRAHPTRSQTLWLEVLCETVSSTIRNERIDNYSPTDNPHLARTISTEYHNVGAVDRSNQSERHAEEKAT